MQADAERQQLEQQQRQIQIQQQQQLLQQQQQLQQQAALQQQQQQLQNQAELSHLKMRYPNWRQIVGAPDKSGDPIDMKVPFRRWLTGKHADYQVAINDTQSAAQIEDAITLYFAETAGR